MKTSYHFYIPSKLVPFNKILNSFPNFRISQNWTEIKLKAWATTFEYQKKTLNDIEESSLKIQRMFQRETKSVQKTGFGSKFFKSKLESTKSRS